MAVDKYSLLVMT